MKGRDVIKVIMETKGVTNADLAGRLHITQATAWDRVNSKKVKDIPVSTLSEMLRALDYKVVIVPRTARVNGDDSYEVD